MFMQNHPQPQKSFLRKFFILEFPIDEVGTVSLRDNNLLGEVLDPKQPWWLNFRSSEAAVDVMGIYHSGRHFVPTQFDDRVTLEKIFLKQHGTSVTIYSNPKFPLVTFWFYKTRFIQLQERKTLSKKIFKSTQNEIEIYHTLKLTSMKKQKSDPSRIRTIRSVETENRNVLPVTAEQVPPESTLLIPKVQRNCQYLNKFLTL